MRSLLADKVYGCLLGGIIGDAMGAPVEGKDYGEIEAKYGPDGVVDFEGSGTDDTAIRDQLIDAIMKSNGYPTVDSFAQSFVTFRELNRRKWFVPVRNAFGKYESGLFPPAYCGWGNMPSSSTAMSFSPIGIINAGNPRRAVSDALQIATFIHDGPTSGFCRDGAAAMCAAVAASFCDDATVESVVEAATEYLLPESSGMLVGLIREAVGLARSTGDYRTFREKYYERFLQAELCDSRETIPATLAIILLSEGDPSLAILRGANFGRDADTIGTMVGGVVGALHGASGLPREWVEKMEGNPDVSYEETTERLAQVVQVRANNAVIWADQVNRLSSARG